MRGMATARAALFDVLETYHFWDWYGSWWYKSLGTAMKWLAVAFLLSLTGAVLFAHPFFPPSPYAICFFGSLVGACVSVALKPPVLTPYGQAVSVRARSCARLLAGVTSGVVGYGLLVLGIVNVQIASGPPSALLVGKAALPDAAGDAGRSVLLAPSVILGFSERILERSEPSIPRSSAEKK